MEKLNTGIFRSCGSWMEDITKIVPSFTNRQYALFSTFEGVVFTGAGIFKMAVLPDVNEPGLILMTAGLGFFLRAAVLGTVSIREHLTR